MRDELKLKTMGTGGKGKESQRIGNKRDYTHYSDITEPYEEVDKIAYRERNKIMFSEASVRLNISSNPGSYFQTMWASVKTLLKDGKDNHSGFRGSFYR